MGIKINEIGNRYGKLLVIEEAGRTKKGMVKWKCQCDCGEINIIDGLKLRNKTRTCCIHCASKQRGENIKEKLIKDIKGQKFGYLTVLKYYGTDPKPHGGSLWECQCDCGNKIIVNGTVLRNGKRKSCGCLHSKGEAKIRNILIDQNIPFEEEKTFQTCLSKNNKKLRFDFYINNNYIIEYDGRQHFFFEEDNGWNTQQHFNETQENDKIKNQWCKKNNIQIIRIPYTYYDELCLEDLLPETSQFLLK